MEIDRTSVEWAVLSALGELRSTQIVSFRRLSEATGLPQPVVRSACRWLREAGLATFETGAADGGGFMGSGYMISREGALILGLESPDAAASRAR